MGSGRGSRAPLLPQILSLPPSLCLSLGGFHSKSKTFIFGKIEFTVKQIKTLIFKTYFGVRSFILKGWNHDLIHLKASDFSKVFLGQAAAADQEVLERRVEPFPVVRGVYGGR